MQVSPVRDLVYDTEPTAQYEDVTPAIAASMLLHNGNNRRINNRQVAILTAQMEAGEWQLSGQSISVDTNGNIIDGQHRLLAVIRSGRTVRMLITRGLHPCAMRITDRSLKGRTAADVFYMDEHKHATILAAGCSVVDQFFPDGVWSRRKMAIWQGRYDQYLCSFPTLENWAEYASSWSQRIIVQSLTCGLGTLFELSEYTEGAAYKFFESLHTGANLKSGSPVLLLRNKLIKNKSAGRDMKYSSHTIGWYVIKAWNFTQTGKHPKTLVIRGNEAMPKIEGLDNSLIPPL